MILRYRVSLPGLKGFARVYELKDTTTLYSFHKQMRADMDFPQDQLVLFKAFDQDGAVSARYGIFDLGSGTIDTVTAGECHKKGEDKFIYFYDTTNVKSVIVTFDGEGGVVFKMAHSGNICRGLSGQNQRLGVQNSLLADILHQGDAQIAPENMDNPGGADIKPGGQLLRGDGGIQIFVDVGQNVRQGGICLFRHLGR